MSDERLPKVGDRVLYRLLPGDADAIVARRQLHRDEVEWANESGRGTRYHFAFYGNSPRAGDDCPAVVVRTFGGTAANLQVLLDGNDSDWVTSRSAGDGQGQFSFIDPPAPVVVLSDPVLEISPVEKPEKPSRRRRKAK